MRIMSRCVVLLFVFSNFIYLIAQDDSEARKLFHDAVEKLKSAQMKEAKGEDASAEFKEAYSALENALAKDPSPELVMTIRNEIGSEMLFRMYSSKDETLKNVAMRILKYSYKAIEKTPPPEEEIKGYIEQLGSDDVEVRIIAMNQLLAIGQLTTPYLIAELGSDRSETIRANSIMTLIKMSDEAVLPVIEALDSENTMTRLNACTVLGKIGDVRSVAALSRIVEKETEGTVKSEAEYALKNCARALDRELKCAAQEYLDLAIKFYHSHPSVMKKAYGGSYVFKFDKEAQSVKAVPVPAFWLTEELAEEACYDGLSLEPDNKSIWALLVCSYFSKYNDAVITLESLKGKIGTEITQEEYDNLKNSLGALEKNNVLGRMVGKEILYKALYRSVVEDKNGWVAVSCIKALRDLASADDLPLPKLLPEEEYGMSEREKELWEAEKQRRLGAALIYALISGDKKVQYEAAECIVHLKPRSRFLGSNLVLPLLGQGVGESGAFIVLIIERNKVTADLIKEQLMRLNCYPFVATTVQEGLYRAKKFPQADLILINSIMADTVVFASAILKRSESLLDSLNEDLKTKNIPKVLLCDPGVDQVKEAKEWKGIAEFVSKTPDTATLRKMIEDVFAKEENKSFEVMSKERADDVARRCAEALNTVSLDDEAFQNYSEAIPGLISALVNRSDTVRLPTISALGNIGDETAIEPLANVISDNNNSPEIRISAGKALGKILARSGVTLKNEVFEILKTVLANEDINVQAAASYALGGARLTDIQKKELMEMKR